MKDPNVKLAVVLQDGQEIWSGEAVIPDDTTRRRFTAWSLMQILHRKADDLGGEPQYTEYGSPEAQIVKDGQVISTLTLELRDIPDPEAN